MIIYDKKGKEVKVVNDPVYEKVFFFRDNGTVNIQTWDAINTFVRDCDLELFPFEVICERYYNFITYPTNNKFKEVRWYL